MHPKGGHTNINVILLWRSLSTSGAALSKARLSSRRLSLSLSFMVFNWLHQLKWIERYLMAKRNRFDVISIDLSSRHHSDFAQIIALLESSSHMTWITLTRSVTIRRLLPWRTSTHTGRPQPCHRLSITLTPPDIQFHYTTHALSERFLSVKCSFLCLSCFTNTLLHFLNALSFFISVYCPWQQQLRRLIGLCTLLSASSIRKAK